MNIKKADDPSEIQSIRQQILAMKMSMSSAKKKKLFNQYLIQKQLEFADSIEDNDLREAKENFEDPFRVERESFVNSKMSRLRTTLKFKDPH